MWVQSKSIVITLSVVSIDYRMWTFSYVGLVWQFSRECRDRKVPAQIQVYCGSGQPEEGPIVGAFPVIVKLSESSFPALVSNVAVIKVLKWKSWFYSQIDP